MRSEAAVRIPTRCAARASRTTVSVHRSGRPPRVALRAVRCAAAVAVLVAVPTGAVRAQTQLALTGLAARDFSLPGAPYLYGASLATYTSAVGVRIGGALGDVRQVHPAATLGGMSPDTRLELGAWTADADLILAPAQIRAVRTALGGLGPYAFVGLGTQGVRRAPLAPRESGPAWSYGGGLAQPLLGALFLEAEARYRMPIVNDGVQPPAGFGRAWEYRVGLALRFGGRDGPGDRDGDASAERSRRHDGRRRAGRGDWDRTREPR